MNASLNEKMRHVKWGEYKLTDVFFVKNTSNILSSEVVNRPGNTPYLCASSENNAVSDYISYDRRFLEKGNCIFIGGKTFVVSYQETDFFSNDSHNLALYPVENISSRRVFLFLASCVQRSLSWKYSWGNSISKAKIQKDVVRLPMKNSGAIDFDFMDSFIAELEAERIAELSAYLATSGLDHYELSREEEKALESFSQNDITFEGFRFDTIFNNIKQGRRLKKEDHLPGSIPFVMSGITNTGVVGYISNPVATFPANSITIDIFGNSFYRNYAFGAGDDTGVYWNDEITYSKTTMLFFAAAMEKALQGKFSYGKKLRSSQSNAFNMMLPVKNGKPDYQAMELLISAIQKLVIKDVVLYLDRKIAATKGIVHRPCSVQLTSAVEQAESAESILDNLIYLPIVGEVAAGHEHFADDDILGELGVDPSKLHPKTPGKHFFLRVSGNSMIGAGIKDGDHVLIRKMSNPRADVHDGDIVVCQLHGDMATLKTFYREAGQIRLHPENNAYKDILVPFEEFEMNEARIIGKCIEINKA